MTFRASRHLPLLVKMYTVKLYDGAKLPDFIDNSNCFNIVAQMEEKMRKYESWGILTDWSNYYKTLDKSYVKTQMQKFYDLYKTGYVFRDYMPVYWSPSSQVQSCACYFW